MTIRGLLLCGGAATRFGSNKLLAALDRPEGAGGTIVSRSAGSFIEALGNTLAVIRPREARLRALLEECGCEVIETERALGGIGQSLSAGVAAAAEATGWIIGLGDMPFLEAATIRKVAAALEAGALISAPFNADTGRRGHPVGFAASLRDELLALEGDEGARGVILRHRHAVVLVPVEDRGIFLDIDTPHDLAQ